MNTNVETMKEGKRLPIVRLVVALGMFLALVALLAVGLNLNPREVPSPLINKPAPMFELPQLAAADKTFSPKEMRGRVWMLNVWASWCVSCREEHPVLLDFSKTGAVPIYGLDYKDQRADGLAWLQQFGDPYAVSAFDLDGKVGIDYGVYGVPETYIIDKHGIIRYKRIGPVTPDLIQQKILPLVKELERDA